MYDANEINSHQDQMPKVILLYSLLGNYKFVEYCLENIEHLTIVNRYFF